MATLGTGRHLSKSWKNPGDEYQATPGLLANARVPSHKGLAKFQYELYQLQQGDGPPVSESRHESALAATKEFHDTVKSNFMGFQVNLKNSYKHLAHFLDNHINNVGDPFCTGSYLNQTKYMERAVLDYFAALWRAEWPHDRYLDKAVANNVAPKPENPTSYWGYILTMGCTEGALYGLWNGRDYLSGKNLLMDEDLRHKRSTTESAALPTPDPNPNRLTPLCFMSQDSHYSVQKATVMFNIRSFHTEATEQDAHGNLKYPICPLKGYDTWPKTVPSNPDGTINVEALVTLVEFFAKEGYPPLVYFSFGTTGKGVYDDIERSSNLLIPILDKYGLLERFLDVKDSNGRIITVKRNGYWFHIDGALGAAYVPFLRLAQACDMYPKEPRLPEFDFSLRGPKPKRGSTEKDYSHVEVVHSIAMSAHKWIGGPVPSGIYMTKSKHRLMPPASEGSTPKSVAGSPATTISNSRSGFASLVMWDHFARNSFNQLMGKAVYTQNLASYLTQRLQKLEDLMKEGKLHAYLEDRNLYIQHWNHSMCVLFKRPNDQIVDKYTLYRDAENGVLLCHVYCMEHVTHDLIDKLIADLSVDGAFHQKGPEAKL